jgi:hypothetical protein
MDAAATISALSSIADQLSLWVKVEYLPGRLPGADAEPEHALGLDIGFASATASCRGAPRARPDFIPVALAAHVAEAIPRAVLRVFPECGHFAYLEAPELCTSVVALLGCTDVSRR